ncbi:hypothetical protein A3D81_02250 [Candidatus Curtissbacteria bacterium RIFCSPHIGHO2_02_FULL_40_17]|uniref:Uncharacterized protein n=1 Tax=Candidatus Curtissbacteria bacterium RIFCSPHIGHO2_02_FULL_40_17 TaxID=1797715 RepID=A0A1F5GGV5_9BACT|nr:MAG: hypothetical protein A3D81_02250 [Candidatus Curtissbacteria bacterium RIFCSPHIGHO2_02_FULL_40_17]
MTYQDDSNNSDDQTSDDYLKHQQAKPPSVTGEEDVFSGDATTSESPNIDEELEKVGLTGDDGEDIQPLDIASKLKEEEE